MENLSFQRLLQSLVSDPKNRRYTLAMLNEFLANQNCSSLQQVISAQPLMTLDPYLDNYVCAMVELACWQKRIPPPTWTESVPPLQEPVFGTSLVGLRLYLLTHSPLAFRRRNIFIDASIGDCV